MKVEIWSDVVCPWCYLGKRQFEEALSRFGHARDVEVVWRSFELDPTAPTLVGLPMSRILERKYGMTAEQARAANERMTGLAAAVGLEYHLDDAQAGNTFDAHRLVHLAARHGLADAMKERLFAAYFTEGLPIGDRPTLVGLAADVGLDPDEADTALAGDDFSAEVREDEATAAGLGVSGVPFFVIDGAYGVSGAQTPDVLLGAMERAWSESHVSSPAAGPEAAGPVRPGGVCER